MTISELEGEQGREAVLEAIAQYDRLGQNEFLSRHSSNRHAKYLLVYEGRRYESRAIAKVAFKIQHPERELPKHFGGSQTTKPTLEKLGFQIVDVSREVGDEPPQLAWKKLVEAGKRSYARPGFEDRERKYKLEIAKTFRQIIEEAQDNQNWAANLTRALGRSYLGTTYNLSHPQYDHSWLRNLEGAAASDVRMAFASFLVENDHIARFDLWADVTRKHAPEREQRSGSILAVGSMLNFALDPESLPAVKATPFGDAERDVGFQAARESPTAAYASHLAFAHLARTQLEAAGLPIQDMLDVQSVIWEFYDTRRKARAAKVTNPPPSSMSRRDGWIRDEIILALDLLNRTGGDPSREDVRELSKTLRSFPVELHLREEPEFRNPEEVEAKLRGLNESGDDGDPESLGHAAFEIRAAMRSADSPAFAEPEPAVTEAREGRLLTGVHTYRERDPRIVKQKKLEARETYGRLACEACGFDFCEIYGDRGDGFIECHHLVPLSEIEVDRKTTVEDLALLCANCHRMVHSGDRWLEMDELEQLLAEPPERPCQDSG